MKKLLLTFICLLAAATYANAETYTFGAIESGAITNNPFGTSSTVALTEFTQNDVKWEVDINWKTNTKFIGQEWSGKNDTWRGYQFGKGGSPVNSLKMSTTGISGTITSVKVTSSAGDANYTISVKVGGTSYTCSGETTLTTSNADYEFTGEEQGEIEIKWENNGSSTKALYMKDIVITYTPAAEEYSVTFDENKMVTFSAPKAVDFSDVEGVTAYIASAVGAGYVTMTAVEDGVIAANTGLLLVADAEGSVKIPVSDNTGASYTTSNLLWDWAAGAEIDASKDGYHAYVLGKVDGDFGFVYITKSHTNTSVNGRAYLLLEETFHGGSGSEKPKRIVFGGEQTGVESVAVAPEAKAEGIYNILGQPVDENYRGFVIRNGVKMYNR